MVKLNVYMWETDIGRFIAVAVDIPTARTQIVNQLTPQDTGRQELADVISGEPTLLGDKPLAILAYEL